MAQIMSLEKAKQLMERMHGEQVVYLGLYYRIPKRTDGEPEFPNPSNHLRWFAFRVDGSVWVMKAGHFPYELIKRFDAYNEACPDPRFHVRYGTLPFHNMGEDDIKAQCRLALEDEAAAIHGRLITAIGRAQDAYDIALGAVELDGGTLTLNDRERAFLALEKSKKTAILRAGKALDAAVQAAETFDVTMDVRVLLDGLKETIKAREEAFKSQVQELRESSFGLVA